MKGKKVSQTLQGTENYRYATQVQLKSNKKPLLPFSLTYATLKNK